MEAWAAVHFEPVDVTHDGLDHRQAPIFSCPPENLTDSRRQP